MTLPSNVFPTLIDACMIALLLGMQMNIPKSSEIIFLSKNKEPEVVEDPQPVFLLYWAQSFV